MRIAVKRCQAFLYPVDGALCLL